MSHLKTLSPETAIAAFKYLSDKNLLNLNAKKNLIEIEPLNFGKCVEAFKIKFQ
jgi:hypothetical protein